MICCSRSNYLWTTLGLFAAARAYDSASECLNVSSGGPTIHPLVTLVSTPCEFMICCTMARSSLCDLALPIEVQLQTKPASQLSSSLLRSLQCDPSRSLVLECESWHPILLTGVADVHLSPLNCLYITDHFRITAVC